MKRFICAAISAVMLTVSTAASAREWVRVSDWAYNDVSVFTSEGLITSGFDKVSDYTENITRGQFTELVCSVLIKTGSLTWDHMYEWTYNMFDDLGSNQYYRLAISHDLVNGETVETKPDDGGNETVTLAHFHPDSLITREDAAVIAYRALYRSNYSVAEQYMVEDNPLPTPDYADADKISDYAADAVYVMSDLALMQGVGGGRFDPKSGITIEQAITLLYKLYRTLPSVPKPDGDGIAAKTETTVQEYSNGYAETKLNNMLYVKNGDISLAFDTDVYANILCVTASDGRDYAVAQTYSENSDIFDIVSGKLIKTVPYCVYEAQSDYIYTKSANLGVRKYGLYDYAGNEVLATNYSLAEIAELKANGFTLPEVQSRDADG